MDHPVSLPLSILIASKSSYKITDVKNNSYNQSSSCAVRSAVSCYNLAHKFIFDAKQLKVGKNEFVLSLPFNGTNYESALLPRSVYVQYDAMRLELE